MISSAFIYAGNPVDKNKKKKKKPAATKDVAKKNDDTTQILIPKKTLAVADSLVMFPSHDLYCSWDTSVIHPYYFEKEFMGDSVLINLTDEWNCGFTIPWKGPVTSGYGWRRKRPHFGTDINLETGDTVVAAFEGKVRIARMNKGYGNVVIIRHNNGLETVYAHLSKILVQPEQDVKSGEVIGLGGNTGHSYGSHLHFEMRYLGKSIDTEDLVDYDKWELKNTSFVLFKEDFKSSYNLNNMPVSNRGKAKSHTVSGNSVNKAKTKYYVVKKGDTLGKIAGKMHTTVKAICTKNGIKQTKVLQPGQRLKV
jgi:murein DD-endopeptidase MepM/ murein hydrolase activator NlpD